MLRAASDFEGHKVCATPLCACFLAGFGDEAEIAESETQPDFICPGLLQFPGIILSNDAEPAAQEVLFQTVQAG